MNIREDHPAEKPDSLRRAVTEVLPAPAEVEMLSNSESRRITEKLRKMVKVAKQSQKPSHVLAAEMIERVEHGKLWPLSRDPSAQCDRCFGSGKLPVSNDGRNLPCKCCSEGWCEVHNHPMIEGENHCASNGGILLPCRYAKLG